MSHFLDVAKCPLFFSDYLFTVRCKTESVMEVLGPNSSESCYRCAELE